MSVLAKTAKLQEKLRWDARRWSHRRPDGPGGLTIRRAGVAATVWSLEGPTVVEPTWGYAIAEGGRVSWPSLRPNVRFMPPPWRYAVPSLDEYVARTDAEVLELERVVDLRHLWEWNYFHFHNDVLGRLEALQLLGVPEDVPLLVGDYVDDVAFARQMLDCGALAGRTWVVPQGRYVRAEQVLVCSTQTPFGQRLSWLARALGVTGDPARSERVMVVRPPSGTRRIANQDAIIELAKARGFEVVDTAELPFEEQARLLSRTGYLVTVHGAGMTNMIYRTGQPLRILELQPVTRYRFPRDFTTVARELGFDKTVLRCQATQGDPKHADLIVDEAAFEQHLDRLLDDRR